MLSRVSGQCSCKLKLPLRWSENKGACALSRRDPTGVRGFPKAHGECWTLLEGDEAGPCPSPRDPCALLSSSHSGLEARAALPAIVQEQPVS